MITSSRFHRYLAKARPCFIAATNNQNVLGASPNWSRIRPLGCPSHACSSSTRWFSSASDRIEEKYGNNPNITAETIQALFPHQEFRKSAGTLMVKECPFCHPTRGDPSNFYKLGIKIGRGYWNCFRCGNKGSWLDLCKKLGVEAPTQKAWQSPWAYTPQASSSRVHTPQASSSHVSFTVENTRSVCGHSEGKFIELSKMPDQKQARIYFDQLHGQKGNAVWKYLTEVREISEETLSFYAVGHGTKTFSTEDNKWQKTPCVTFPWIMSLDDIEEMERARNVSEDKIKTIRLSFAASGVPGTQSPVGSVSAGTQYPGGSGSSGDVGCMGSGGDDSNDEEHQDDKQKDWSKSNVKDLKEAPKRRGLPRTGEKANRIKRLQEPVDEQEVCSNMKVAALKEELKRNGLPFTGQKSDLAKRLTEFYQKFKTNDQKLTLTNTTGDPESTPRDATGDPESTDSPESVAGPTFLTRRIKVRSVENKSWQRMEPPGGGWGLFGFHTVPRGAKELVVTEGEFDAMAVYQATGRPAVSLPSGCRNLPLEFLPILERFEKIILWMDDDKGGKEGAEMFTKKLGVRRTYTVTPTTSNCVKLESGKAIPEKDLPKDANDALKAGLDLNKILNAARIPKHPDIAEASDYLVEVMQQHFHPELFEDTKEKLL